MSEWEVLFRKTFELLHKADNETDLHKKVNIISESANQLYRITLAERIKEGDEIDEQDREYIVELLLEPFKKPGRKPGTKNGKARTHKEKKEIGKHYLDLRGQGASEVKAMLEVSKKHHCQDTFIRTCARSYEFEKLFNDAIKRHREITQTLVLNKYPQTLEQAESKAVSIHLDILRILESEVLAQEVTILELMQNTRFRKDAEAFLKSADLTATKNSLFNMKKDLLELAISKQLRSALKADLVIDEPESKLN
jgi:hypothetical protein